VAAIRRLSAIVTDLLDFKDAGTQAVVWPPNLASGALVIPTRQQNGAPEGMGGVRDGGCGRTWLDGLRCASENRLYALGLVTAH